MSAVADLFLFVEDFNQLLVQTLQFFQFHQSSLDLVHLSELKTSIRDGHTHTHAFWLT